MNSTEENIVRDPSPSKKETLLPPDCSGPDYGMKENTDPTPQKQLDEKVEDLAPANSVKEDGARDPSPQKRRHEEKPQDPSGPVEGNITSEPSPSKRRREESIEGNVHNENSNPSIEDSSIASMGSAQTDSVPHEGVSAVNIPVEESPIGDPQPIAAELIEENVNNTIGEETQSEPKDVKNQLVEKLKNLGQMFEGMAACIESQPSFDPQPLLEEMGSKFEKTRSELAELFNSNAEAGSGNTDDK